MHPEEQKSFRFRYTVFTVTAQMTHELLHVQMGIRQINVRLDRLQHLYVDARRSRESVELILSYVTKSGKLKRARVFADHGETGLQAFVDAVLERRPEIDIRHLSAPEAYDRMGARSGTWYALPLLMSAALLLVAILCTPLLIHGLDTQRTEIDISAIDKELPNRTLRITGGQLVQTLVVNDAHNGVVTDQTTLWMPLVDNHWTPEKKIKVLVQILAKDLPKISEAQAIEGLLRNIWWEGLSTRKHQAFVESDATLDDNIWLIDSRATPGDDLGLALLILVTLGSIVGGVTLILYLQHRRRKAS